MFQGDHGAERIPIVSDAHPADLSLQEVLKRLASAAGDKPKGDHSYGRVRHLDEKKGYGFISPDGGGPDVFFHKRAVQGVVQVGHRVEFDVEQGDKGPWATCVCITFSIEEG